MAERVPESLAESSVRRANFRFLLLAQVLLFISYPLAIGHSGGSFLVNLTLTLVLLSGAYAASGRHLLMGLLIILAAGTFAGNWGGLMLNMPLLYVIADSCGLLFFALVAMVLLGRLLSESEVSIDTIIGAISVYLLAGFAFAYMHLLVQEVSPDAYLVLFEEAASRLHPDRSRDLFELVYFSFVTLTTLGFGDILPIGALARAVAMIEVVFGQIYLTVLVARLVGLHISRLSQEGL